MSKYTAVKYTFTYTHCTICVIAPTSLDAKKFILELVDQANDHKRLRELRHPLNILEYRLWIINNKLNEVQKQLEIKKKELKSIETIKIKIDKLNKRIKDMIMLLFGYQDFNKYYKEHVENSRYSVIDNPDWKKYQGFHNLINRQRYYVDSYLSTQNRIEKSLDSLSNKLEKYNREHAILGLKIQSAREKFQRDYAEFGLDLDINIFDSSQFYNKIRLGERSVYIDGKEVVYLPILSKESERFLESKLLGNNNLFFSMCNYGEPEILEDVDHPMWTVCCR